MRVEVGEFNFDPVRFRTIPVRLILEGLEVLLVFPWLTCLPHIQHELLWRAHFDAKQVRCDERRQTQHTQHHSDYHVLFRVVQVDLALENRLMGRMCLLLVCHVSFDFGESLVFP